MKTESADEILSNVYGEHLNFFRETLESQNKRKFIDSQEMIDYLVRINCGDEIIDYIYGIKASKDEKECTHAFDAIGEKRQFARMLMMADFSKINSAETYYGRQR